jgi:ankyrin repeat protein
MDNWEKWLKLEKLIENKNHQQFQKEIDADAELVFLVSRYDRTLLMRSATYSNNCRFAETLVKNGADVNFKNKEGTNALMFASDWGEIKTAAYLLKQGTNLLVRDCDGKSAFEIAFDSNLIENKQKWIELYGLYKNQLDEKDLELYYELRLSALFFQKTL